jgi:tetratricopeptide (TPR) repeat protein
MKKNLPIVKLFVTGFVIFLYTLQLQAQTAEEYREQGYDFYREGNWELAIKFYQKAIALDPNDVAAYTYMAGTYCDLKQYREAIICCQKALAILPSMSPAHYFMGIAYAGLGNYDKALACYQKAIDLDPNNYNLLFSIARLKGNMGDRRGAITEYDKLIQNSASIENKQFLATIYNNKAHCLVVLGEYQAALPFIEEALLLEKGLSFIWDTKGELCYHLRRYEECVQYMDKAISITDSQWAADGGSSHNNSYYYKGLAKIKLNKKTEGVRDVQKAAKLGSEGAQKWLKNNGYSW